MTKILYFLIKIKYILFRRDKEVINNYFRRAGITIGKGCNICCDIMTSEPYLIRIGSNVTISNDVQFVTHDNSISKIVNDFTDVFGEIFIGDNVFIGARSTLMYGITIESNIIVASGSVVTKSFNEKGIIIGGNPAKKIGEWKDFSLKTKDLAFNIDNLSKKDKFNLISSNKEKLIKR